MSVQQWYTVYISLTESQTLSAVIQAAQPARSCGSLSLSLRHIHTHTNTHSLIECVCASNTWVPCGRMRIHRLGAQGWYRLTERLLFDERSGSGEQPRWPSSRTGCRHPAGSSFRVINGSYGTEPSQRQILSLITPCAQALACVAHQITRVCARSTLPLIAACPSVVKLRAVLTAPACPGLRMHALPYGPAGRPAVPSLAPSMMC